MLYCSGTDSYRLARKTIELNSSQDFNITIPSKSLTEVVRSVSGDVQSIFMQILKKHSLYLIKQLSKLV